MLPLAIFSNLHQIGVDADVAGFSAEDCIGLLVRSLQTSLPQLQENLSKPQLQVPENLFSCARAV